ncbi:MAG: FAD-dependent monooxygenase [Bacteroidetes bacterium]|nr:FAD-dependent monooxygenase [Bacteroidota bacterium]
MSKNVTVVGAGLVGSLLSIYLSKKGYNVSVYERRDDMRKGKAIQGRSINLALSDRGWKGLEGVGIADEIKKIAIPMYGRYIHNKDGTTAFQPYGTEEQAIYSVSRATINMKLMDLAEQQNNVKIHFNKRCIDINKQYNTINFENVNNHNIETTNFDLLFGADGAFSASRLNMQTGTDRFEYNQHYINCAYKELIIPPGDNETFKIEKNALHIWPRGSFMMIALPNPDGNFTCTLFLPFDGKYSFDNLKTKESVTSFFNEEFKDAVPLMPTLVEDFFNNPTSSLVTVKCYPWTFDSKIALIGDAAHAIVPFYGQGMNCGFEDCVVLNELMNLHGNDWEKVLSQYQILRKPDADAIADLAIANFVEMRDKTADKLFLLQKKIEAHFSKKHPDKWIPLYSMVTYSPNIRYSKALEEGQKQQAIMDEIMAMPDIENKWNSEEIEQEILSYLY